MRADARRNYERLLSEARQAFMVHGTEAPLEDIARHAGVGIGTLYRHFPNRYALMDAVFEEETRTLVERAEAMLDAESPLDALLEWLRAYAAHSSHYRGLAVALMEADSTRMPACKGATMEAADKLLVRTQQAGEVSGDVVIADLMRLTGAIVVAAERNPADHKGTFDRLMALALDGFRARPRTGPPQAGPDRA
jgi:AcrR family transcriptional regulator